MQGSGTAVLCGLCVVGLLAATADDTAALTRAEDATLAQAGVVAAAAPPSYTVFVELVVETKRGPVPDLRAEEVLLRQEGVQQELASVRPLLAPGNYEVSYVPRSGRPGPITVSILRAGAAARGLQGNLLQPRAVRNLDALQKQLSELALARPDAHDFLLLVSLFEFEAAPDGVHHVLAVEIPTTALGRDRLSGPALQFFARLKDGRGRQVETFSFDLASQQLGWSATRLVWRRDCG